MLLQIFYNADFGKRYSQERKQYILQGINDRLVHFYTSLKTNQYTYIIACNEKSHTIWSPTITLCWYLCFLNMLRNRIQMDHLCMQFFIMSSFDDLLGKLFEMSD